MQTQPKIEISARIFCHFSCCKMMQTSLLDSVYPESTEHRYHKQLKSLATQTTTIHDDQLFQVLSQFKSPLSLNLPIIEEIQSILAILLRQIRTQYLESIFTWPSIRHRVSRNGQGIIYRRKILIPLATLYEKHPSIFQKCIIFNNFNFLFPSIEDCQSYFMALEDKKYHSFAENRKLLLTILELNSKFKKKGVTQCSTVHKNCTVGSTVHTSTVFPLWL